MQNTVGSIFEKREERRYDSNMKIGLGEELCGSGSGYCQVARCGLFGYLDCATREVVSKMYLMGCEDGRWVYLGQDIVKWRDVACLGIWVVLPERWSVRPILGEWVVRMGGGCTWIRILSSAAMWLVWVSGLCYQRSGQ